MLIIWQSFSKRKQIQNLFKPEALGHIPFIGGCPGLINVNAIFHILTYNVSGTNSYDPMKENGNQTSFNSRSRFKSPVFDVVISFISRLS